MTRPVRLLHSLDDEQALRILSSWAQEEPPPAALHKTVAALGLATTAAVGSAAPASGAALTAGTMTSSAGSVATGAGTVLGTGLAVKWLAAGFVGGALALSVGTYAGPPREPDSTELEVPVNTPPATPSPAQTHPSPEPQHPEQPTAAKRAAEAKRPPVGDQVASTVTRPATGSGAVPDVGPPPRDNAANSGSVAVELALLDEARRQIQKGDPQQALSTLRRYDAESKSSLLDPEAAVVRIHALHQAGRRAEADGLVRRFVALYPLSPHATSLLHLLRTPSPSPE